MSTTPSTVDEHHMDEHEEMDADDHLDSSSNVLDSSKEGETDDQSSSKPKRNRKSTQRLLDSFMDDEFAHKPKKKPSKPTKKDYNSDAAGSHTEDMHSDAPSEHEQEKEETEKEKKPRVIPGKPHVQCTFMESKKKDKNQCKQRAIESYLFCIWHILNDKNAPYKRCAHMRDKNKNGVETRVQCKTAIKASQHPPLCLAHSDRAKKPPKKKRDSDASAPKSSPLVQAVGSVAPSSPSSSSLFNLPNEDFAQDIDEVIGNIDASNLDLIENFDDFDNLALDDEMKDEDEEETKAGVLGFEPDDAFDSDELAVLERILETVMDVCRKVQERLKRMRAAYDQGAPAFWAACHTHKDEAPNTKEEYEESWMQPINLDGIRISAADRDEVERMLNDPHSELSLELGSTHQLAKFWLEEQRIIQHCFLVNKKMPQPRALPRSLR